jgi:hypothetical protein
MLRFTRVVALPDPKNSDFPSRINSFRTAGLQDTCRSMEMTSAGQREEVFKRAQFFFGLG